MRSRGVLYYNIGRKCLSRLGVSIFSLRKHYSGPVTVIWSGKESGNECKKLLNSPLDINLVEMKSDVSEGFHKAFMDKTLVHTVTPYDTSIFLDTDTLVVGKIDELFDYAEEYEFICTQFSDWVTTGRAMAGRIQQFNGLDPLAVKEALKPGPGLNVGVYSFIKESKFMADWNKLTMPGRNFNLPEESACMVYRHRYPHKVVDQKFNCSCRYSNTHNPDIRIIHYHGDKHCRNTNNKFIYSADLWMNHYEEIMSNKIPGLVQLVQDNSNYDKFLKRLKKPIIEVPKIEIPKVPDFKTPDITLVTAVTEEYLPILKLTYKTWDLKSCLKNAPILIFSHGLSSKHDFDFLKPRNYRIVDWDMPKYDSQRELMLSSFVLGSAKYVETPYWMKLDSDSFFHNDNPLFEKEDFDYDLVAPSWGVSRTEFIIAMDKWAEVHCFSGEPFFKDGIPDVVKYKHNRFISYLCLHRSEIVRTSAAMSPGRLPIPSHDSYLWYLLYRFGGKYKTKRSHKFSVVQKRGLKNVRETMIKLKLL